MIVIDLGLDCGVRRVLKTMKVERPPMPILTVGGNDGKGSCVAFLGHAACGRLSRRRRHPHLLRYNERVCINGAEATDAELCQAFANVDAQRGDVRLTYFEFGTLAALDIFREHKVDVAVLEVGMGGRLDAVNAVDADGALVVSIGLDHQEWLGNDRDSIGYEKAGIYREQRPAICGDREPPLRLLETARRLGAELKVLGRDFDWRMTGDTWCWRGEGAEIKHLPVPALSGCIQFDNASSVLALLQSMISCCRWT